MSNLSQSEINKRMAYLDGQIEQTKLYAALWIAKISSGAYLLSEVKRGREATDQERSEGITMGWRDLTDKEKLTNHTNIALTHIQRLESLYVNRHLISENRLEEIEP